MTTENVATGYGQRCYVAVYVRVSTTEQHPGPQVYALRSYSEAGGLEIAAEYLDHGVSTRFGTQRVAPCRWRVQGKDSIEALSALRPAA
jgi:DNA invertase Pin-like site-specific DNA recombinase